MASVNYSFPEQYPILAFHNISKKFPGVLANDDLTFEIKAGEILAILGENGAGKSTLMKILSGLYQPDEGYLEMDLSWFRGEQNDNPTLTRTIIANPADAIKLGIGQVYQHFKLIEPMTVTENIILGKEFTWGKTPFLNQKLAQKEIIKLGEKYRLVVDPKAIIEEISVGLRQRVEILKQLFRKAQLLILDEPTAVLTPLEVEELFKTMRELKAAGKTLIFISHKLKEPLAIADRIIVMRGGKLVGETTPDKSNEASLAEMLVGRPVLLRMDRKDIPPGKSILEVENLTILNVHDLKAVDSVSFKVRENEIVGIAGVQGNGQTELVEGLMGLRKDRSGSIKYYDNIVEGKFTEFLKASTLDILEKGVAYIPEDRSFQGIIQEFSIKENSWLGFQTQPERAAAHCYDDEDLIDEEIRWKSSFKDRFFLPFNLIVTFAKRVVQDFEVMTPTIEVMMKNLSGGNQQKVILGREFAKNPRLIIASQPTRGVDIGVTEHVRNALLRMRDHGSGILLVSSDLDEVLSLSDYILILYEGKIVGQGPIDDFAIERVSQLMTSGIDIGVVKNHE